MPMRLEGVLLSEHRNGRGSVVAETRVHFERDGRVLIIRWEDGGDRLPEEWISLPVEAAEKLQRALWSNAVERRLAEAAEAMRKTAAS
jgi:hypothetical protein